MVHPNFQLKVSDIGCSKDFNNSISYSQQINSNVRLLLFFFSSFLNWWIGNTAPTFIILLTKYYLYTISALSRFSLLDIVCGCLNVPIRPEGSTQSCSLNSPFLSKLYSTFLTIRYFFHFILLDRKLLYRLNPICLKPSWLH